MGILILYLDLRKLSHDHCITHLLKISVDYSVLINSQGLGLEVEYLTTLIRARP